MRMPRSDPRFAAATDHATEARANVAIAMRTALAVAEARGISLGDVAAACGIQVNSITAKLSGRENITIYTLASFARAIKRTLRVEFVESAPPPEPEEPIHRPIPEGAEGTHRMIQAAKLVTWYHGRKPVSAVTLRAVLHTLVEVGYDWETVQGIASRTNVCDSTARDALRGLEALGLIDSQHRPREGKRRDAGGHTRYHVRREALRAAGEATPTEVTHANQ